MDNDVEVGQIVNCDNLHCAKVLSDTEASYQTGPVEFLAPLAEDKYDPKASVSKEPFDGVIKFVYAYEGESENTLTISGLTVKRAAELTGKPYDPATGRMYDSGDLSRVPQYAVGYRHQFGATNNVTYSKYYWFLKGIFYLSATTGKTAGNKVDPQSQELVYVPFNTIHKWDVPDPLDASKTIKATQKRTVADTTDPAFTTENTWFAQVQTPDTIGASPVLALSGSTPADDATGVLATAKPMLTFSNAISDDAVVLIRSSDNSIVAVTKAYDATGKVLTLSPSANLTAGAAYQIVVAGVKDIFGQSLAPSVINFTVIS